MSGWIQCYEKIPERNVVVRVRTSWGEETEGVPLSDGIWLIGKDERTACDSDIVAWMPKPCKWSRADI